MKLNVLAVLLVVMPSTAMAGAMDSAWFSLEGAGPGITATGGPGQTLVIEKPIGPAATVLTIGFNISVDHQLGMTGLLSSWGFQLDNITQASGFKILSFGGANFSAGVGGSYNTALGTDNAGGGGFGAGAFDTSNTGLPGLVFEFDIVIDKPSSEPVRINIFGDFRPTINSTGYAWYGDFGPVPNVYGLPNYGLGNNPNIGSLPVITITKAIPEPVTLALFGAGMVLLLRRRRRAICG